MRINQNHLLRFWSLNRSIFPKISTSLFSNKITYMRVFRSWELDFEHQNTLGQRLEEFYRDFHVSRTQFWLSKLVQITLWVSTSRFLKKYQFYPLILWLQIWESSDIRNSIMVMTIFTSDYWGHPFYRVVIVCIRNYLLHTI